MESKAFSGSSENDGNKYFRFQVFQGNEDSNGSITKSKSVGMAYLKDGQNIFTIRLWMLLNERFYMIPNRNDSSRYLIMTREPNRSQKSKNKYFWNIVGNGVVNTMLGVIRIEFDLLEKVVYLNVHPESSAFSASMANPEFLDQVA
jgi:hypothetical protein